MCPWYWVPKEERIRHSALVKELRARARALNWIFAPEEGKSSYNSASRNFIYPLCCLCSSIQQFIVAFFPPMQCTHRLPSSLHITDLPCPAITPINPKWSFTYVVNPIAETLETSSFYAKDIIYCKMFNIFWSSTKVYISKPFMPPKCFRFSKQDGVFCLRYVFVYSPTGRVEVQLY